MEAPVSRMFFKVKAIRGYGASRIAVR
jgi:hypothetical protein